MATHFVSSTPSAVTVFRTACDSVVSSVNKILLNAEIDTGIKMIRLSDLKSEPGASAPWRGCPRRQLSHHNRTGSGAGTRTSGLCFSPRSHRWNGSKQLVVGQIPPGSVSLCVKQPFLALCPPRATWPKGSRSVVGLHDVGSQSVHRLLRLSWRVL